MCSVYVKHDDDIISVLKPTEALGFASFFYTRCPKKLTSVWSTIEQVFRSIFKISSVLNKTYLHLDFEIKIVEIR